MKVINICGDPTRRGYLIEDAIMRLQADPTNALMKEYLGIKNYAAFGDQREDHEYNYGPKHGTIVFSIGRTKASKEAPTSGIEDAVYYLECYRDFPVYVEEVYEQGYRQKRMRTLAYVLDERAKAKGRFDELTRKLESATVESHEKAA